jgi:hypothetical protein
MNKNLTEEERKEINVYIIRNTEKKNKEKNKITIKLG